MLKKFSKNYWVAVFMEFMERGSYYGVMSILSVYMVLSIDEGGLGFTKEKVGIIKSVITPILYVLPILAGTIADRFGYRRSLMFAFSVMSIGYLLTGMVQSYEQVFLALILMVIGAGTFKPVISGTIARTTDESTSTLGFGIFYWSINLGAFIFPLILIPWLKAISWSYIFYMAAIGTGSLLLLNFFVYKEPERPENTKPLSQVFEEMLFVLKDFRFILLILLYSTFWILYFQMFDTVLWYLTDYVDVKPINAAVNAVLALIVTNPNWVFDAEHVTVLNAGTIIILQIWVSKIVEKYEALPTMITGLVMGTVGIAILAVSNSIWVFMAGIVVFSVGEMTAHPKFLSYVGIIAPEDKKALYLGYAFLYGVIGSGIGGVLGATLYTHYVDTLKDPQTMWLIFTAIGCASIAGLLAYNRFMIKR